MDGKEYLISIICSKCTVTIHCCGCKPSMWKPIPCVLWYTDCWYTCIGFSHCCSTVLYDIQTVDILISATDVPQQRRIWTGGGTTPAPGSTPPSTTPRDCSSTCRWLAKSLWCVPPSAHGYLMLTSLQLSAHSCIIDWNLCKVKLIVELNVWLCTMSCFVIEGFLWLPWSLSEEEHFYLRLLSHAVLHTQRHQKPSVYRQQDRR